MDDRFKNAMDAITPDENMIERIIKSEVGLFRHALTLLCWGLVLTSFNINIESIELALYSTWIGNILITLGLWMLRTENRRMAIAYHCSLFMLFARAASYWIGAFPDTNAVTTSSTALTVISYILLVVKIYCLFSGLRDLALRFENEALARRLMRCFWLYISLCVLLFLCVIIPFLMYLTIPYALFVLIRLPVTVGKLKQYVPLGHRVTTVKAINKWVCLTLCLYITITIGGEFGCLYYVNVPKPDAVAYINTTLPDTIEIRDTLKEFGMPEYVLRDLPDNEVLLYEGIYIAETGTMNSSEIINRDGGKLEVYNFSGVMPDGRVRILLYYRWIELPKHTFIDLLSVPGSMKFLPMSTEPNVVGLSLYDKNGKTYKQALLNDAEFIGFSQASSSFFGDSPSGGIVAQMRFRLYPNYENQRGYIAMDAGVTTPDEPVALWVGVTYVHQQSLWNRPYFSALNKTASNGYSHIRQFGANTNSFWSECFDFNLHYEPDGWVWPEN